MTSKSALPLLAILGLTVAVVTLVFTQAPSISAVAADGPGGGLQVIGGQPPILFEPGTGKTWVLVSSPNVLRKQAWVPIKRLDTEADIQKWHLTNTLGAGEKDRPEKDAPSRTPSAD
jgi:hypothetical protein